MYKYKKILNYCRCLGEDKKKLYIDKAKSGKIVPKLYDIDLSDIEFAKPNRMVTYYINCPNCSGDIVFWVKFTGKFFKGKKVIDDAIIEVQNRFNLPKKVAGAIVKKQAKNYGAEKYFDYLDCMIHGKKRKAI